MSRRETPRRLASALGRWPRAARALLGRGGGTRQTLVTLALNSSTSLLAGGFLGAITGTLERHPGLLVLVPPAIGLRGNVFATLGSRLSTASHAGTLRMSGRRESLLAQNVLASLTLTIGMSLVIAVVANMGALIAGVEHPIPMSDLALVSIVGGLLASVLVLVTTVGLAGGAVRYGWDLDNVIAPTISTLGDVLTLPALWAAAHLLDREFTGALAWPLALVAALCLVAGFRTHLELMRRVVRQSVPILCFAAAASTLAGIVLEGRLEAFTELPTLLILVPTFMSSAGALGGIVASRVSTKLHLGFTTPAAMPDRAALDDMLTGLALGLPVAVFNALGAFGLGRLLGHDAPSLSDLLAVSLLGGLVATALAVVIAYASAVGATRAGLDPDTYGIPAVTSTIDFAGAFSLVFAIVAVGLV